MTIVIHLPAPLDAVGRVLEVLGEEWPDARVDTNHPDGWHIELHAPDGRRAF